MNPPLTRATGSMSDADHSNLSTPVSLSPRERQSGAATVSTDTHYAARYGGRDNHSMQHERRRQMVEHNRYNTATVTSSLAAGPSSAVQQQTHTRTINSHLLDTSDIYEADRRANESISDSNMSPWPRPTDHMIYDGSPRFTAGNGNDGPHHTYEAFEANGTVHAVNAERQGHGLRDSTDDDDDERLSYVAIAHAPRSDDAIQCAASSNGLGHGADRLLSAEKGMILYVGGTTHYCSTVTVLEGILCITKVGGHSASECSGLLCMCHGYP